LSKTISLFLAAAMLVFADSSWHPMAGGILIGLFAWAHDEVQNDE